MIDTYYKRNVIGISGCEFLWGLGLPVVLESTFLQLFLKSLGASSFQVGLIPAFAFLGSSVFALISSYFTAGLAFKRGAVIYLHLISGMSLVFFGAILLFFGEHAPVLMIFFVAYAVFTICVGMTLPVWLNYLVNIFSEERAFSGLGYMMIAQNIARLTSGLLLVKFVAKYSFSQTASGGIFLVVGLLFCLGSLFFLVTKETSLQDAGTDDSHKPFFKYVHRSVSQILQNRNFLIFLVGDMDFYVIVTVISFYAHYATSFCGIAAPIAAGFFVSCIYVGAIFTNIFLGSLDFFLPRNKYIFSKMASMAALLLLIVFGHQWSFFLASFLLGVSRGTRMIVFPPSVKKLSGLNDTTSYFAMAPILTIPFALALPMSYGFFLDRFSYLNGTSYRIIFLVSLMLVMASLYAVLKVNFQPTLSRR
jgi:Na+/melibiose symporter-like transporter